jgi:hypothetical protein
VTISGSVKRNRVCERGSAAFSATAKVRLSIVTGRPVSGIAAYVGTVEVTAIFAGSLV